jgi:hypothetical protein
MSHPYHVEAPKRSFNSGFAPRAKPSRLQASDFRLQEKITIKSLVFDLKPVA